MSIPKFVIHVDGFPHAPKDPNAVIRYVWDWSKWVIGIAGERIASAAVTPDAGITPVGSMTLLDNKVTQLFSGGTAGASYKVVCQIRTAPSGLVDDRTIVIDVTER